MNITEMKAALDEAERTMRAADIAADQAARLLKGRLRRVSPYILKHLKKEMRDFNISTGRWKECDK